MSKLFRLLVALSFIVVAPNSYSETVSRSASSGPAQIFVSSNQNGLYQVFLKYDGYLHACIDPSYEPKKVNVHLIFKIQEKTEILVRQMQSFCRTPSNYGLENVAIFQSYDLQQYDSELFLKMKGVLDNASTLEVAFESDGHWDSDYSQNYHLYLK